ncbi:protein fuzzy-like [Chironomus tepperi]|uniref:protein fuzzy-like n=1 Tax=Chironomus tepperi TaxID=113505 RepID=UPI00391EF072
MSIYLMCLYNGTPIFNKKRGDNIENLPFSTTASFSSVHLFCRTQNVELTATTFGDDGLISWKEFESLLFVGISTNLTEKVLKSLIEKSFQAMVLHIGINEIKAAKNVDRLKRDLKSSFFQMIEKLMEYAENDLLDYNESILCHEAAVIHEKLISFSELSLASQYCFLLSKNRIICATDAFYDLHVVDRKLLILLLTQSNILQKDIPVYLPHKSPTIAYRLIGLPLIQGISIGLLCGQQPTYDELEVLSQEFWQDSYDLLLSAEISNPRNFPPTIELDSSILGFLLINKFTKKYVISRNIQQVANKRNSHRMDIIRTFFHQAVDCDIFKNSSFYDSTTENITTNEHFYVSDYHKCHALIQNYNILCVLYLSVIPTYTMRFITQELLNKLLGDKSIEW